MALETEAASILLIKPAQRIPGIDAFGVAVKYTKRNIRIMRD